MPSLSSTFTVEEISSSCIRLSSVINKRTHMVFLPAKMSAIHPVSINESTTIVCLLKHPLIDSFFSIKTYLETSLRYFSSPTQSESEYFAYEHIFLSNFMPLTLMTLRYLSMILITFISDLPEILACRLITEVAKVMSNCVSITANIISPIIVWCSFTVCFKGLRFISEQTALFYRGIGVFCVLHMKLLWDLFNVGRLR